MVWNQIKCGITIWYRKYVNGVWSSWDFFIKNADIKVITVDTPSISVPAGQQVKVRVAHGVPSGYTIAGYQVYPLGGRAFLTSAIFYSTEVAVLIYNTGDTFASAFRVTMFAYKK